MKTSVFSLSFFAFMLLCVSGLRAQEAETATPKRPVTPALIVDNSGELHIKEWIYQNATAPEGLPTDSLNQEVQVCVTITKDGELKYYPVGYNNPLLYAEVEAALSKPGLKCIAQAKWDADKQVYIPEDYTTFAKIKFCYVMPKVKPDYTQKEFPAKWNRKNMYKVYRGNLLRPSFHQGKGLQESISKFREWVAAKIIYPNEAIVRGVEGSFAMSFYVDKELKLQVIDVVRSPDESITNEVKRVIGTSPIWQPALRWNFLTNEYDYIRTRFYLTLDFKNPYASQVVD